MKTRNKILSGLVLSTLLGTGLYANCMMNDKQSMQNNCSMHKGMQKCDRKEGFNYHNKKPSVLRLLQELNLTADQETKIKDIMLESRKNIKTFEEAFTKDSFDKSKYMEIMTQQRDNMIKSQADVLEKSYAILTSTQKEQLKVLMDLRKEKMEMMPKIAPKKDTK